MGGERARYGRKSWRERIDDVLAWPGAHRGSTAVILIMLGGAVALSFLSGRGVERRDLAVGDCLYVPTAAARDPSSTRPIGEAAPVEEVVVAGGAQRTPCNASHGHEVSAVLTGPEPTARPIGEIGTRFDRDAIHRLMQPLCEAAFAGYVGGDLAGSAYVTFPVASEDAEWVADGRRTVCLVARSDGQWMDGPARSSGE
jgi:hypothetical protein